MGVYIKGLEMPTTCEECPGYREDAWYGASCLFLQDEDGWAVEIDDGVTDEYDLGQERHPKCPLVEIKTPHGRLIDGDELLDFYINHAWDWSSVDGITTTTALTQMISDLKNAPTILEAEE